MRDLVTFSKLSMVYFIDEIRFSQPILSATSVSPEAEGYKHRDYWLLPTSSMLALGHPGGHCPLCARLDVPCSA